MENYTLKEDKLLYLLVIVSCVYTGILVYCQNIIGIDYWDIFVYLNNAMLFAHINIGSQLSVPPVLSLITSILFQMGFISELSLFCVSGALFVFLMIGIYLLFNYRFPRKYSFIASLLFSMTSLVVTWAVSGSNDLPSLAFAVWALLFTIKAVEEDSKYYYLAFGLFLLSFFTRFTGGFVLIVMISYILLNMDSVKKQVTGRNLTIFILFFMLVFLVIGAVYYSYQGGIPFIKQFIEVSNSNQVSSVNVGYELNSFYYLEHLPKFISSYSVNDLYFSSLSTVYNTATPLAYVILILSTLGILTFVANINSKANREDKLFREKILALGVISIFIIISYSHISYLVTEILFIGLMLLLYKWLPNKINKIDLLMILWMGIFIILHSYHPVKVDRYIVTIIIPIIYFMILAADSIGQHLKNKKTTIAILGIILILMLAFNANYLQSITHENPHTAEEKKASQWLKDYDDNLTNENISSDRGVAFSWYLKKYTYTTIPRVLQSNNESLEEKLNSINAKYYIDSTSNITGIEGYHRIYTNNNREYKLDIYEKDGYG
ncbi:MAG: glycosyltransferase family 39 protein [Methanosphaera sp.]|nr:glycosyltransferase family 39 protein [Methanosphaera sp.]